MDSRNITEETPHVAGGLYLDRMYQLQRELLNHYTGIEKLPMYPINIHSRDSQILLKDFTSRVIEELAEGYESQLKVQQSADFNGYFYTSTIDDPQRYDSFRAISNHVQNVNEELADAMHFMLELMVYCNIQPSDIKDYIYYEVSKVMSIPQISILSDDILDYSMKAGSHLIVSKPVRSYDLTHSTFRNIWDKDYMPIGWVTSPTLIEEISKALWDVTYSLSISRNCLKNKPWKQSEQMVDEGVYQRLICEAFVKMMGYFDYLGLTSKTLFTIYFKKNMVNQFRIKSKY